MQYIKSHPDDSGIIYCQSRKSVDNLSSKLQREGIRALPYHAGLPSDERAENQEKFVKDDVEIITATIAFGMGIDKPNVRYVIHCDMPKSIEGYYQETGRAGRDRIRSDCILFFSYGDKIKHEYFIKQIENEQYQQIAYKKMRQIVNFCTSKTCRRKYLLDYFGEKHDVHNCRMCDVCNPVNKIEIVPHPKGKVKVSKANNIKPKSYSVAQIQTKHPAAYQKWTKEEEQKLISEYNNGKTIKELSEISGRQPGGIKSRLKKLCNV